MNSPGASAIFLIQLVQDVNILRPLVVMSRRDFGFDALLLVSARFSGRDAFGIWRAELEEICAETGARLEYFDTDWEAHQFLVGHGLLFAASESSLANHAVTHNVMRHAPAGFLRVTLQHGFECVGFRHSADHVRAYGPTASFGADLLCAWSGDHLTAVAPSQRGKLLVTGPSTILQMPATPIERRENAVGIVFENLHSVRLNVPGNPKLEFVDTFGEFCRLRGRRRGVRLRPHPGGQFALRNKWRMPSNVKIENAPMYRLDLRRFAYGISAPSSVVVDLLLAGIPTAIWRDDAGRMDVTNYEGLTTVSTPREWVQFARAAERAPEPFLALQRDFLERQNMILEPREVFARFAGLFRSARRMGPAVGGPSTDTVVK